jgi:hypothetical protein
MIDETGIRIIEELLAKAKAGDVTAVVVSYCDNVGKRMMSQGHVYACAGMIRELQMASDADLHRLLEQGRPQG